MANRWLSRRSWLFAVVVLLLLVVVVAARNNRGTVPTPPSSRPTPAGLRATPMTGHVTGGVPASCQEHRASDGQPLPDRSCTPGVVSAAVSQDNLSSTICHSGYTKTVRPPASDTGVFKKKIMVAYHESGPLSDYELDHLVSLELGGSNDAGNLWPERNDHARGGINSKDPVENALNKAVCSHKVTLPAAQAAIAADWTTALARLGLPPAAAQ